MRYANQLPQQLEAAIVQAKRDKPHWGARKIRELLVRRLPGDVRVPANSTIHAVLDRNGLVNRPPARRNRATGTPLSAGTAPNDLWCADFKGEFRLGNGRYCYPLTVTDHASRYLLLCEALESTREDLASTAFERLFKERGLTWADVDFAKATITVRQRADKWGDIGSPKAASSWREIPVPPPVITALKEWKLACPRRDTGRKDADGKAITELHYVFTNGKGRVELLPNIRRRQWHPLQIEAGVSVQAIDKEGNPVQEPVLGDDGKPVTGNDGNPVMQDVMRAKYTRPHALRHFLASWCLNSTSRGGLGLSLKETQERSGHATLSQTADRYGHLFVADATKEREILAAGERALMGA